MHFIGSTITVLLASPIIVYGHPNLFRRNIFCDAADKRGKSTRAQIAEAMNDINTSLVYGFNPPNQSGNFVNCVVDSNNFPGQFCCQVSKRAEHNCAIALVMNNLHGRCSAEGRVFAGQNLKDNVNDILSHCPANEFAGIKELNDCITLHVGPTGC